MTLVRFLNEDPWERLRQIAQQLKIQNCKCYYVDKNPLGYRRTIMHDVVRLFVEKSVQNGIDIIRVFDALNDVS